MSDQIPLACQVEALGAGRALDGKTATPEEVAMATQEVLTDPSYATAAHQLAELIAATLGNSNGASRLEELIGYPLPAR